MQFSKSRYTLGRQCSKILWMNAHKREWYDDSAKNQDVLERGDFVGDLAMGYYGPYVEVPFDSADPQRFAKAAAETKRLLEAGERTICEATFMLQGHYCMVDILRVRDDSTFDIVEVKSSGSVHKQHYDDMAYQCWLVQECGYKVASVSLMHINSGYVRHGSLDLQGLFTVEDCTEIVMPLVEKVSENVERMNRVADSEEEPLQVIGEHCFKPYECGYRCWCFRDLPERNGFEIAGLSNTKVFALIERGVPGLDAIAADEGALKLLNEKQRMQVLAEVNGWDPLIDEAAVREFLDGLWFPLYFLDFESYQEAVPAFDDQTPYEQVTSQYSLHWVDAPKGDLHHTEFLAEAGMDPRRSVAERLCADIPADACVLAWNMSFEKTRIKRMAELYPDLAPHLMAINDNIRDLMLPFKNRHYYMKEMQGSYSIKKVLPALFPDDPELDYHALEGVHNGGEASTAFLELAEMPPEQQAIVREQLLRYCELDTLAMVKIWQKLVEVAATNSPC